MLRTRSASAVRLVFFSACMFLVGMQMAETGAALARMSRTLDLTAAQEGILVAARFTGGIVFGLVLWLGSARIRITRLLSVSLVGIALSGLLLLVPTFASALTVAAIRGLAVGAIIPLSGVFAASQTDRPVGVVTGTVNAAVSAGLVLLSGIALLLAQADLAWQVYWAPSAVVAALLLVGGARVRFPDATPPPGDDATPVRDLFARTDWLLATAGFLLVGSEAVLLGLIPAQSARLGVVAWSGEGYALLLMAGILVGRVASSALFARFGARAVLRGSAVALIAVGALWSLLPGAAPLFVALFGLATAGLFPGLVAFIAESAPRKANATIAAVGWTGGVGGTLLPAATGAAVGFGLANRFSVVFHMAAVALVLILTIVHRRRPGSEYP